MARALLPTQRQGNRHSRRSLIGGRPDWCMPVGSCIREAASDSGLQRDEVSGMIAHISIGVRDIDNSKQFSDAALMPLGYRCLRAARTFLGYGYERDSLTLWLAASSVRFRPTRSRVCISASPRRIPTRSTRFTPRRCAPAAVTTARLACARNMGPITLPHSSLMPTDIRSKLITVRPKPEIGRFEANHYLRTSRSLPFRRSFFRIASQNRQRCSLNFLFHGRRRASLSNRRGNTTFCRKSGQKIGRSRWR
jgi:hypothetical protein